MWKKLFSGGATVPFISRYRKEMTGSLDEVKILQIKDALEKYDTLEKRKITILGTIKEIGKLTPELEEKILNCFLSTELEDIYLPYKPKRRTRAEMARNNGLEPLAENIFCSKKSKYTFIGKSIYK